MDAFAGSGKHVSRDTGEFVMGSPARALEVIPPFDEYHFVDMDKAKVKSLEDLARDRANVTVHEGDCNSVLLDEVFPRAQFKDYRRALCLLDPYSLQLDWNVIRTAGEMGSVEIFLNFPIMDINRNVLRSSGAASASKLKQMTRFWGDESWHGAAYRPERGLFDTHDVKVENWELIKTFQERLRAVGGFKHVPEPMAMRNSQRSIGELRRVAVMRHIWWGVSVEDRKYGVPRIDHLRDAPATVRFLSVEPLLEDLGHVNLAGIDWVIVGGESGPRARPMRREWVTSILDQCEAAGVPFFFKQWGGVRKKKAGRELNGRTYDYMPRVAAGV